MSRSLPERVTKINDTLELEWYKGDSIVVYVLSKMSPEVLQRWAEVALDVMRNWPPGNRYLALYDLSHRGVVTGYSNLVKRRMCRLGITEAGEERALASIAPRKDLGVRVALYTSMTYSGQLGSFLAEIDAHRTRSSQIVKYDAYFDREAALDWLKGTHA